MQLKQKKINTKKKQKFTFEYFLFFEIIFRKIITIFDFLKGQKVQIEKKKYFNLNY